MSTFQHIDTLLFRFPVLQIASQAFAVSEEDSSLIAFIDIKNNGYDLSNPSAQLIINGIGSTKDSLDIDDIPGGEQKKELYCIKLGNNISIDGDKLTGYLKVKNNLGENILINVEMPNPFISVCVVKSNSTSIIFEKNVEVELMPGDQNTPLIKRITDENGLTSFSQQEVGSSAEVTLSLPGRSISRTLPISHTKKHHCSLDGALTANHKIQRQDIDNISNTGNI